jgi:hypothetical protein
MSRARRSSSTERPDGLRGGSFIAPIFGKGCPCSYGQASKLRAVSFDAISRRRNRRPAPL